MEIEILDKYNFKKMYNNQEIEIPKKYKYACISINSSTHEQFDLIANWTRKLQIIFEDTNNLIHPKIFTIDHAKEIINYLNLCKATGIDTLIIHCFSGISRSAAVGLFAKMYYTDEEQFNYSLYVNYNRHVFNTLAYCYKNQLY